MNIERSFSEAVKAALASSLPVEAFAVADEQNIISSRHFVPSVPRNIYSHTKSYMSTAAGIAISEGRLSLTDKLCDMFPEYVPADPDPRLLSITLRDLLIMASGKNRPYLMGKDRRAGTGVPDYMRYYMDLPMELDPGESFVYSSADSIIAGRMIERAVGTSLSQYLYDRVFAPLGQGYPIWENDPQGHPVGCGGLYMTLEDMMKLGMVYLAGGKWHDTRIVDAEWIGQAAAKQIEIPAENDIWRCGYGYQFWMSPYPSSYRADGAYGQITTVLPEKGLVVAMQCPENGDLPRVKNWLHGFMLSL